MCGYSTGKLGNDKVYIALGYYGGSLEVGDVGIENGESKNREEMRAILKKRKKDDLIDLLFELVENAEEG
jgi:hypothetical protein